MDDKDRNKKHGRTNEQIKFNPKQWRKEVYDYQLDTEGYYPKQPRIKDKRDVKFTTYHCGGWTKKVRNPKKDTSKREKQTDYGNRCKLPKRQSYKLEERKNIAWI